MSFGAYAEYKCMKETDAIAIKPDNISHAEAASIPFGATTALAFLRK
jgi:NADPH:quinone reductase-like Zn-dependent oxidoreductase